MSVIIGPAPVILDLHDKGPPVAAFFAPVDVPGVATGLEEDVSPAATGAAEHTPVWVQNPIYSAILCCPACGFGPHLALYLSSLSESLQRICLRLGSTLRFSSSIFVWIHTDFFQLWYFRLKNQSKK